MDKEKMTKMNKKKKILLILTAILLSVVLLLGGSFVAFHIFSIRIDEMYYEEYKDNKILVSLCMELADSKDYERQIKHIKNLIDHVEFTEFDQILQVYKGLDKNDREVCYQVILTRYLEAYLHLGKTEQYLSEFPVVYTKYLNERNCFEYIKYSIIDNLISEDELNTVLTALENHMEHESSVIQLFNLDAQSAIYSSVGNRLKMDEVNRKAELLRRDLIEQNKEKQ